MRPLKKSSATRVTLVGVRSRKSGAVSPGWRRWGGAGDSSGAPLTGAADCSAGWLGGVAHADARTVASGSADAAAGAMSGVVGRDARAVVGVVFGPDGSETGSVARPAAFAAAGGEAVGAAAERAAGGAGASRAAASSFSADWRASLAAASNLSACLALDRATRLGTSRARSPRAAARGRLGSASGCTAAISSACSRMNFSKLVKCPCGRRTRTESRGRPMSGATGAGVGSTKEGPVRPPFPGTTGGLTLRRPR